LFGTDDSGRPVPWYQRALFSATFSWIFAFAVGHVVGYRTEPKRPRD
jgi:hypothetical protein